jgi:competence protein ComEC
MRGTAPTNKAEIAFVRILLPFTAGILVFYNLNTPLLIKHLILVNIVLFIYLFTLNLLYKRLNIYRRRTITGLLLHCLLFLLGALCSILYNQYIHADYYVFKNSKYLKIKIIDEPQRRQNIIWFTAFATKCYQSRISVPYVKPDGYITRQVSGKIRVTVRLDTLSPLDLKYGEELMIPSKFSETEPPGNPSEFDFKSWLAMQNIYHQTFLKQRELIKLYSNKGNTLILYALELRERQVAVYRKLIKDDNAFAVASTLILGYRSDLDAETLDIYAKTGTIHALSVSGMHVGLIYLVLNWLLSFLDRKRSFKHLKTALILILIWFYALLTGFSPSVLRSAIMLSVFITAKISAKTTNSYNIIAFAAFCLLLYNPFLIWDVGFQLSFLAVFGLIYLQPAIHAWIPVKNHWLDKVWGTIAISLAAQLATYPFSIYYFHQFPLYFLFSNLFIMLPMALIMYLGIVILIFKLDCLGGLFEWLIVFTNAGLNRIANLPLSGISAIWISKTELFLLCLALMLFVMAMKGFNKQLLIASLVVFLSLQSFMAYDKLQALRQKKTIRFRLRKNYALALISSNRAILYTDLKPESKAFKYSVKPALDQHRITSIIFRKVKDEYDLKDN